MRYPRFTAVPSRLIPLATLLLATALGGCVAYPYPPRDASYPGGYYAGYPRAYNTSYGYRPYSPDYGRY